MPSIDQRIVSMKFDNAKFEAGLKKTMASLEKLNASLKTVGATKGLSSIEKAAKKITLGDAGKAADKLKSKMEFSGAVKGLHDIEAAAHKVTLGGVGKAADDVKGKFATMVSAAQTGLGKFKDTLNFSGAERGFNNLQNAAGRISFAPLTNAFNNIKGKFGFGDIATKSFADIEKASHKVSLSGINTAITEAGKGFSVLSGAAAVAFGNIVSRAALAGGQVAKSLTFSPVTTGFKEYELQLNAVQTILANTQASGATLKDVNATLNELNQYADKTIYNFGEMAKNVGTFTAAGVDLKTASASIKGIANLAALSGSNSEQASTAMYQLSQAISAGKVGLQDWNSVVNAGMGGTTFQRALAQTAEKMGTLKGKTVELVGPMKNVKIDGESFRDSLALKPGEKSWITGDVLTNTLKQFTGDMTDAQLATMGFTAEQIKAIQLQAKTAQDAATKVKTISAVIDTAKEAAGSGWAQTWQLIFGDFGEAKKSFTGLSNVINNMIGNNAKARNSLIKTWRSLGGRDVAIEGLKNAFKALQAILKPIKDAFHEIFPATTGKRLFELTKKFRDFTASLKIGPETAANLKRTFAGFFAILSIGKSILAGVFSSIKEVFKAFGDGSGGILEFTGSIGDLLVALDKAIKKSEGFKNFFIVLGKILAFPIRLLSAIATALSSLFTGVDESKIAGAAGAFDKLKISLDPLKKILDAVGHGWQNLLHALYSVQDKVVAVLGDIVALFPGLADKITEAFKNADYSKVFDIIQTVLIAGIFTTIKKALGGGLKFDIGGGVISKLKDSLDTLRGSLKSIQTDLKANALLKIAIAIGILAVGIAVLSNIDGKKLASAMTALAIGLGELLASLAILSKIAGSTAALMLPFIAASLILLAIAVDILAIAVFAFSKLSWEELIKGLAGVGGVLAAIGIGVRAIPLRVGLIGPALIPLAIALTILAGAVKIFSTLKWEELAKGLVGVGGALAAISLGLTAMPTVSLLVIGPGLILVAGALLLLSQAVQSFGNLNLITIGKGLVGIALSLVVIGGALTAIPPTVALQAAGLVILALALNGIAIAIALMGNLKIVTIAKGIIALGGAITVLGRGLLLMNGTLPGAAALAVAAAGLLILAPALGLLGTIKIFNILKGLAAIAGVLVVLGIGGVLAAPGLIAVAAGLAAIGLGVASIGAGVYLFAKGLSILSAGGQKGLQALLVALLAFVAALPGLVITFVKGLVQIVGSIATVAPKLVAAFVVIVNQIIDGLIQVIPKVQELFLVLLGAILEIINTQAGPLIEAGVNLLLNFLKGISDNIGEVVSTVGTIIITFLTELTNKLPDMIVAGANTLIAFLEGVTQQAPEVIASVARMIVTIIEGLTAAVPDFVAAGTALIVAFIQGLATNIGDVIIAGGNLIVKVLEGIGNQGEKIALAAAKTIGDFLDACAHAVLNLIDKIGQIILNFLHGIAAAIRKYEHQFVKAGFEIGSALLGGLLDGIIEIGAKVLNTLKDLLQEAGALVEDLLGLGDESVKVTVPIVTEGAQGAIDSSIKKKADKEKKKKRTHSLVSAPTKSLSTISDAFHNMADIEPVITPVLDLTNVEKEAQKLHALTNITPITAARSFNQARSISTEQAAQHTTVAEPKTVHSEVKFIQNNYSPESLSTIEIYRRTNNQFSQAKHKIGLTHMER